MNEGRKEVKEMDNYIFLSYTRQNEGRKEGRKEMNNFCNK